MNTLYSVSDLRGSAWASDTVTGTCQPQVVEYVLEQSDLSAKATGRVDPGPALLMEPARLGGQYWHSSSNCALSGRSWQERATFCVSSVI